MSKVNDSDGLLSTSIDKYPFLGVSPSDTSRQADDFEKRVAEEIEIMLGNELAVDVPMVGDEVDFADHIIMEPDDSQPLRVEPPLTLSKIFSKLTAIERLWLARMVKSHGKALVFARWPVYEIHINYVRSLGYISTKPPYE